MFSSLVRHCRFDSGAKCSFQHRTRTLQSNPIHDLHVVLDYGPFRSKDCRPQYMGHLLETKVLVPQVLRVRLRFDYALLLGAARFSLLL